MSAELKLEDVESLYGAVKRNKRFEQFADVAMQFARQCDERVIEADAEVRRLRKLLGKQS